MMTWTRWKWTRRKFLGASVSVAAVAVGCDDNGPAADSSETAAVGAPASSTTVGPPTQQILTPTPACADGDDATPEQTEGPYFTPNSPERASLLEAGMAGERLVVSGRVLSTACERVAGALLDFWQADNDGMYDNEGFVLRGHQFASDDGTFRLETIVPGIYPGRTRHIHVMVQAPDQPALTTQLYFPGEAGNASDGIFDDALVMDVSNDAGGKTATFDFVLDLG